MKSAKIAFVGVGRMGANMARHLQLDCGYKIAGVYDKADEIAAELAEELGCTHFEDLTELAAASDVIFTVISDDAAMREIYDEEAGLLQAASGKTFVNCATLSPAVHREIAEKVIAAGGKVLEAAMASSISQAREGKLYLMVGGSEGTYEAQKELLEDLSVQLRYCGEMGRAAEVKALVNMVMNANTAALAEGLGLADALGLDLAMVSEIFAQTGAHSRVLETDAEDMMERDHECWFSASHAAKDSGIAAALAEECGLSLPVNEATLSQYHRMMEKGLGELDKSGVAELTFKGRST